MSRRQAAKTGAWANGIMPRASGPVLSWFVAPSHEITTSGWLDCIDAELAKHPSAGPGTASLMERFRAACAFDPANCVPRAHTGLQVPAKSERVLLIDEPTATDFDNDEKTRARQFVRMATAAHAAHHGAEFWLARSGAQHVDKWLATLCPLREISPRLIGQPDSLCASIPHFDHVYTVSAPEGMQALLCNVPLHVFGTPWYAGRGLTYDHARQPEHRTTSSLDALFEAAFVRLARHLDPVTRESGSLDALLTGIEVHRATVLRFADMPRVAGVRFQWWKRPLATPYLTAGGSTLRWVSEAKHVQPGEHAAFWGARSPEGLPAHIPAIRIEDGFLHSTGLGSDHVAPLSQVIDRRGLYFDASCPNDLTHILNDTEFGEAELARARALRSDITRLGLTKYNLGRRKPGWLCPSGKRMLLVPGQVADDASIRLGTSGISTAEELLREVRASNPGAFIVYKPHPDVLSGNRPGLIEAEKLADIVETNADLISLLEVANEVHTLSSLAGFEALIRGKPVSTYGLPFYAGWGLTQDALEQRWRRRKLSLDMLTAGVLLRYPLYWDWSLRLFTTPEAIVRQLAVPSTRPLDKIYRNNLRPLIKATRWSRNVLLHARWRYGKRN
ncbi:capsular polysaccharide export protein, LipB/KpsS family [Paraburkholderia dioscoreae]|nr:capsular biosynthesis protein [Paraburkholderia dioscoreae]